MASLLSGSVCHARQLLLTPFAPSLLHASKQQRTPPEQHWTVVGDPTNRAYREDYPDMKLPTNDFVPAVDENNIPAKKSRYRYGAVACCSEVIGDPVFAVIKGDHLPPDDSHLKGRGEKCMTASDCRYTYFCKRTSYEDDHGVCSYFKDCDSMNQPGKWDAKEFNNFKEHCQCSGIGGISNYEDPIVDCGQQYQACMGVS